MLAAWWHLRHPSAVPPVDDVLIVGTNAEYFPFSFLEQGVPVGFDIDIAREVCTRLGKKMHLVDMPFDMLLPKIQLGDIHIIAAAMSPKPERAKHVLFTQPYLQGDPLLIITPIANQNIDTVSDLAGKTVVVNDGYTSDAYISGMKDVVVQRLATPAEAFLALKSGRAQAYVAAQSSVERFLNMHPDAYRTIVINDVTDAYALVISPLYPELAAPIQQALDAMTTDGTLETLKLKWKLS